jgi:5-methyltetrahydrofolate--homocysteine methyltransferase
MSNFRESLNQPGVLVSDGATGTMLQLAGLSRGVPPERWNLENPEEVRNLHQSYIQAGADIILTNTFGGTHIRLEKDHLGERTYEINLAAAKLAREAAGDKVFVFGDIGPIGMLLKPYGALVYTNAVAAFQEQAAGLAEGGVDAIWIETMSDLNEAKAAVEGARQATDLPILVCMSFDTHGFTMMGIKPEKAVRELWALGIDAVGANCGRTLTETLAAVQEMRSALPEAVLVAKPNAGLPHREKTDKEKPSEVVYDVSPQVMGEYALKFKDLGVKIFGGCCGSTPEHIRAIAQALKS